VFSEEKTKEQIFRTAKLFRFIIMTQSNEIVKSISLKFHKRNFLEDLFKKEKSSYFVLV